MSMIPASSACCMHGMDKRLSKAFISDVRHMSLDIYRPSHLA